jgi:hypothetical protein
MKKITQKNSARIVGIMKTVSQKMGIKENSRVLFINAPSDAIDGMKLPEIDIAKD